MTDLRDPIFHDDEAAAKHFEAIRWPDGPYCPLCGGFDRVKPTTTPNKAHGHWYHCGACRRRFSSTMGTVCERSHIPLTKWLLAMHLMAASKKGHVGAPAAPDARRHLQNRVVYGDAHSRSDAPA